MTEKKFTKFELARMKRTAQNVDRDLTNRKKLLAKIAELQAEVERLDQLIELADAPTKAMTGGYGTEDIIKKVVTPTDKLDKNGNVIKITSYEFLYPETIIPVAVATEGTEEVAAETAIETTGYSVVEELIEEA